MEFKIIRSSSFAFGFSMPLSFTIFFRFLKIYRKFDVIHIHEPFPIGTLLSLITPKKIKLIITWHSDIIKQTGPLKTLLHTYKENHLIKLQL